MISGTKCTFIILSFILFISAYTSWARADDMAPGSQNVSQTPVLSAPSSKFALVEAPAEIESQAITPTNTPVPPTATSTPVPVIIIVTNVPTNTPIVRITPTLPTATNTPTSTNTQVISNTVVIRDENDHFDTDTITTTLMFQGPILQIKKDVSDTVPVPGEIITYTLTYSNVGDLPATGVVITETVPNNTTFVGPDDDWNCDVGDVAGTVCTHPLVIPLSPGESGIIRFIVQINNSHIMRGIAVPSVRDVPNGGRISTSLQRAKELRFEVVYYFLDWNTSNAPGFMVFDVLDDIINQARAYNLKLILRIYDSASGESANTLPSTSAFQGFMERLTTHVRNTQNSDVVLGYVIWNEPNLGSEWYRKSPNAAEYVALLQAAYRGAKRGDPNATIVSAPLAPTVGSPEIAVNDIVYLTQMYESGVIDYLDYVGMNGLGFQYDPDRDTGTAAFDFMRLKYLHDVMLQNGDIHHQVWALEVGWLRDSNCDLGSFNAYKVSKQHQIEYLTWAFQKAEQEWPWLDTMVIWNLDFYRYYPQDSAFYWYSMVDDLKDCPDDF